LGIGLAKLSTLLVVAILLAVSLTLAYVQSNKSSAPLTTPTSTIVVHQYGYVVRYPNGSKVFVATTEYTVTPPTPPKEFKGPMVIKSVPGLNATFVLSSGVVKAGESLWVKAVFGGEKASSVCYLFVYLIDPEGVVVKRILIPPPKVPTPIPGVEIKPRTDRGFRIDIPDNAIPGRYTIIINVTTCDKVKLLDLDFISISIANGIS